MLTLSIRASENMQRLIDDLLNIGRFKTGRIKLNRQFFDAKYLGVKMTADYSGIARQKGIEITNMIPENSRIYADRALLTEAVQNLVTNAIKFCARGDQITISLAEKDATAICVRDTGPGIRPDMLDNIFKYEKKTTTKGTAGETGTGFGLPLTKDIIELHGGKMGVKSEPGKGCLFSLKLPYVRPQILLVDNDSMFRLVLKLLMKELGADVIEAENGEDAMNIMAGMLPHLIMTDIKMPGMDGIELLKRVKDGPDTKDIPVFVVTGEYGMEIRDTVFKLGADDFATKDINTVDFLPRVRRYIG
jgi:CheY-like chemotaxis protein/anti-sigma regulatory factor (Ser/Thr protein kinase)